MSGLLKELQRLKPKFPEIEFEVPEWGRKVTLRGFSLREGRALRQANGEADEERFMLRSLAHAIAKIEVREDDSEKLKGLLEAHDDRPLANDDGIALLEELSAKTLQDMVAAFMKISGIGQDAEGNSAARAVAAGSSSDSPSPSVGQSLN